MFTGPLEVTEGPRPLTSCTPDVIRVSVCFVVSLLSVYLFVSACVVSAGFPSRSVHSNVFTGDFSCNYTPIPSHNS